MIVLFLFFALSQALIIERESDNATLFLPSPPFRLTNDFEEISGEFINLNGDGCGLPFDVDVTNKIVWMKGGGKCSFQKRSKNCKEAGCKGLIITGQTMIAGSNSLTLWDTLEKGLPPTVEIGASSAQELSDFITNKDSSYFVTFDSEDPNPYLEYYHSGGIIFARVLLALWTFGCVCLICYAFYLQHKKNASKDSDLSENPSSVNKMIYFVLISELITNLIRFIYIVVDYLWTPDIFNAIASKLFITSTAGWELAVSIIIASYWIKKLVKLQKVHEIFEKNERCCKCNFFRKFSEKVNHLALAIIIGILITGIDVFFRFLESVAYVENIASAITIRGVVHLILITVISIFFLATGIMTFIRTRKVILELMDVNPEYDIKMKKMSFCIICIAIGNIITIFGTILIILATRVPSERMFGIAVSLYFAGFQISTMFQVILLTPRFSHDKKAKKITEMFELESKSTPKITTQYVTSEEN